MQGFKHISQFITQQIWCDTPTWSAKSKRPDLVDTKWLNLLFDYPGTDVAQMVRAPDKCSDGCKIYITVSIHCAPEMSEIDCIGRIETFWPKFVRGW